MVLPAVAIATCLSLSGCVDSAPEVVRERSTPQEASSAPLEMKEADVIAAAVPVFNRYIGAVVEVGSDHSIDASVLRPYASDSEIEEVRGVQDRLKARGQRMNGLVLVERSVLQDMSPETGTFTLLICEDLSNLRILDGEGLDVTPSSRSSSSTVQVSFEGWPDNLRIDRNIKWTGASAC